MTPRVMSPGKSRVFYGWFALAGVMLVIFVTGGAFIYSYGVLLPIICNEFGWSRAEVATGLSLGIAAFGLPSPLWAIFVARFGPRVNTVLGNMLAALGLAGFYLVQEIWHVYLLCILIGLGAGLGGYIASATVASNWFIRKRSLALGMFIACSGLGGFVFPPLVTLLISTIGWRISWLVLAGMVFVVVVLIGGLILVRNRPEDMGQVPDGISAEALGGAGTEEYLPGTGERVGWQARQALRMPTTWLIAVFVTANAFAMGTLNVHQVAYMRDIGFDAMTAAMTLSLISVFHIVGGLGFGALALRFNIRHLASASFVVKLVSLGILLTTRNLTFIYVYAALLGMSNGALITALPTFVGEYYGRARYALALGVLLPFQIVSQAVASMMAGAIYDITATYTLAFAIITAFSLVGLICVFLLRKPELPQPKGGQ